MEDGEEQVALEFTLRDNCFASISFRALRYHGEDYLAENRTEEQAEIAEYYLSLIAYLQGKPVSCVNDLYPPAEIAADAFSGATPSASKVISAVWDALNRRAYRLD